MPDHHLSARLGPLSRLSRFVLLAAACGTAGALTPASLQAADKVRTLETERVMVKLKPQAPAVQKLQQRRHAARALQPLAAAQALAGRLGQPLLDGASVAPDTQIVIGHTGLGAQALAARLARDPDVLWAEVVQRRHASSVPNDPLYPDQLVGATPPAGQWALRPRTAETPAAMDVQTAWDSTEGSEGVVVAIIDTGILAEHPDLAGSRLLPGYDFIADQPTANDGDGRDANPADPGDWITSADAATATFSDCAVDSSSWHGTMGAGLVAAATNNGIGVAGIAPGVSVLPLRALGKCGGYDSDIIAAMRWAAGLEVPGVAANPHPANIINLSLGSAGSCTQGYADALAEIAQRGVLVVAAAGNEALGVDTPANCTGVMAVGAVTHDGLKANYSNLGPQVAISAPGGDCGHGAGGCQHPLIMTTDEGTRGPLTATYTDGFHPVIGSSFSTVLVSGVAALTWSANPQLTAGEVRSLLASTAQPFAAPPGVDQCVAQGLKQDFSCACTSAACGVGMVDAAGATQAALAYTTAAIAGPSSVSVRAQITLSGTDSRPAPGQQIASYTWALTSGASLAQIVGASNASSMVLEGVSAGDVGVQLKTVDSAGHEATALYAVSVKPASPAPPASVVSPGDDNSSQGGGTMSPPWLLLLGACALALRAIPALYKPRRDA